MPNRTISFRQAAPAQAGMTLLELIMVCAILLILATAAMPLARFTVRRQKEAELRRDLRDMRDAIDRYKDTADRNLIRVEAGSEGYPPDLATLVTGVDISNPAAGGITAAGLPGAAAVPGGGIAGIVGIISGQSGGTVPAFGSASTSASTAGASLIRHLRFLRRIPIDPMTGNAQWGMRSVQDDPDSSSFGGKDLFDVYSLSSGTALDGTSYKDW